MVREQSAFFADLIRTADKLCVGFERAGFLPRFFTNVLFAAAVFALRPAEIENSSIECPSLSRAGNWS